MLWWMVRITLTIGVKTSIIHKSSSNSIIASCRDGGKIRGSRRYWGSIEGIGVTVRPNEHKFSEITVLGKVEISTWFSRKHQNVSTWDDMRVHLGWHACPLGMTIVSTWDDVPKCHPKWTTWRSFFDNHNEISICVSSKSSYWRRSVMTPCRYNQI